jgi:hypothetical protein
MEPIFVGCTLAATCCKNPSGTILYGALTALKMTKGLFGGTQYPWRMRAAFLLRKSDVVAESLRPSKAAAAGK